MRQLLIGFILAALFWSPARAQQQTAEPVRLADLEAEVERNHPAILAAQKLAEAKRARVAQARSWPDPQLSIGYMGDPAPFRTQAGDPSSFRQLGVMQEIPYFGKRDLRARVAEKEADAEQPSIEAARRRVLTELRQAYFDLWALDEALAITERNKDLLEKLAAIAAEKYKVGQGLQQDVLRAQVEVTRILQRLTLLRQQRRTREAQINSLLSRPAETSIAAVAPVEKQDLTYSLEELTARALADYPEVRRQERFVEQGQAAEQLARKEFRPDFAVGWDYVNRPGMPEMYGLQFTMNLPVFNGKRRRAAVSEAQAMQESARQTREAVRIALSYRIREEYLAARASEELLVLYQTGVIPQSRLTLEAALASYQTGRLDFLNVISNFTTLLEYEVSYYQETANYQKALARLEELTGLPLVSSGASQPGQAKKPGKEGRQ